MSRYGLITAGPARRTVTNRLPRAVAEAALEFITGPLLEHPHRVGNPLGQQLTGIYSARLGREWRVLYEIDDHDQVVTVLDIRHRAVAYRPT